MFPEQNSRSHIPLGADIRLQQDLVKQNFSELPNYSNTSSLGKGLLCAFFFLTGERSTLCFLFPHWGKVYYVLSCLKT